MAEVIIVKGSLIVISGDIKSIDDYQKIKEVVRDLIVHRNVEAITVDIPDSASVTSSVIGFFLKLVYEDKINMSLQVKNERLYSLLETLNLTDAFNVSRV